MSIDETDFGRRDSGVLQLHGRSLFATQHHDILAFDTDCTCASFDCFQSVFDLKDVAIGTVSVSDVRLAGQFQYLKTA
jgi:hypothetical protein